MPRRLNGLPHDLEPTLLRSYRELMAPYPFSRLFPPFHPRPYAFRWITAGTRTDANGAFMLDHLVEGEYRLVCTLPPDIRLAAPLDPTLKVKNAPFRLTFNYASPQQDLGVIEMTYPAQARETK